MIRSLIVVLLLNLLVAGCSSVPFQKTTLVSLESADARNIVERFKEHMPDNFQLLNTVVFEYNGRKFSAHRYGVDKQVGPRFQGCRHESHGR